MYIHDVATSKYFNWLIVALIVLNTKILTLEYHNMPNELDYILKISNYFFTTVFVVETIMKLIALGVKRYLEEKWNQLDFVIIFATIFCLVLEEVVMDFISVQPTIVIVLKSFMVARVLRVLKLIPGARALLNVANQIAPLVSM